MAAERFGLDTNVLVYLVDGRDPVRQARAREVLGRAIDTGRCVLSVQSLGEFFVVVVRKGLATPAAAQQAVDDLVVALMIASPAAADVRVAIAAASAGRFAYWDALLLATLERAGCTTVLSEDMGDGASLGGVRVRNPFAGERLPDELVRLLSDPKSTAACLPMQARAAPAPSTPGDGTMTRRHRCGSVHDQSARSVGPPAAALRAGWICLSGRGP